MHLKNLRTSPKRGYLVGLTTTVESSSTRAGVARKGEGRHYLRVFECRCGRRGNRLRPRSRVVAVALVRVAWIPTAGGERLVKDAAGRCGDRRLPENLARGRRDVNISGRPVINQATTEIGTDRGTEVVQFASAHRAMHAQPDREPVNAYLILSTGRTNAATRWFGLRARCDRSDRPDCADRPARDYRYRRVRETKLSDRRRAHYCPIRTRIG